MRRAPGGSSSTSVETAFRVLNRKCGLSCAQRIQARVGNLRMEHGSFGTKLGRLRLEPARLLQASLIADVVIPRQSGPEHHHVDHEVVEKREAGEKSAHR